MVFEMQTVLAVLTAAAAAGTGPSSFDERLEASWRARLVVGPSKRPASRVAPASDAAGGCDGVKNGGFGFHTERQRNPWWQVDLGKPVAIGRVVVFNRCTEEWNRADRLHVMLSDDGRTWRTVYRHDGTEFKGRTGKPLVVELDAARARFVRLMQPADTWMHLDEVEVYATAAPKKNVALNRPADQSSASRWSDGKASPGQKPPAPERAAYVRAVGAVLAPGRLLAADLAAGGVDTSEFAREADAITADLEDLTDDDPDLKAAGLYVRARRAVRQLALKNPLLDFDRLLILRRSTKNLALPANWQSNSSLRPTGYDNDLAVLTGFRGDTPRARVLLSPQGRRFVGDVDLHFDARRMLFSMPDDRGRWRIQELRLGPDARADGPPRPLELIDQPDVHNYDGCYLPDGGLIFTSTAPFIGVPCVRGNSKVTNLYLRPAGGGPIRRLSFDQDHDWCPTVLPNGRVMYLRWEYSGLPHSNSRILFHMNPDGTGQMALYGSNSYWPNGVFYARPVPGHPSRVVGIVTGHHGVRRMGELVAFDPAIERHEAEGALLRFGGAEGKPIEAVIADRLVDGSWPRFLHPWPLGGLSAAPGAGLYVLAACRPTPSAPWGLYLADSFGNLVLLYDEPGKAILEPLPLRPRPAPPAVASKVDPARKDAVVYLADVYRGGGLDGVPRGAVKKLRLLTYHFSYHGVGGLYGVVGTDGPWDCKRVLGTVPVEPDGSALFRIPANRPIAVQPLDDRGQAMQIMRSWFVGMPGENVSCVGCHERSRETAPPANTMALAGAPEQISPWRGPERGFAYAREVQPVIDRYCLACHDPAAQRFRPGRTPDLRGAAIDRWRTAHKGNGGRDAGKFSIGYVELSRYVRRPGIESEIRLQTPMEFHASTTELVQMLRAGHHGVRLDEEAWDRLITWIDLNAPYHGTWGEIVGEKRTASQAERRRAMLIRYAGVDVRPEEVPPPAAIDRTPVVPPHPANPPAAPPCAGWPFDAAEAARRREALGETRREIDLGEGVTLDLLRVPAGRFVAGAAKGLNARPPHVAEVSQPFWIGRVEVTNAQFARFDPLHDSRVESKHGYQFGVHGYPANRPAQPVVRVSWRAATAFCQWLSSRQPELAFSLPTGAQWEWACRAGSDEPFWYGQADTDFSKLANLGDAKLAEFASDPYTEGRPMSKPNRFDDWLPKDARFHDGSLVAAPVGSYRPNPWGLCDMHGNVWEWTLGRAGPGRRVARGGSWYDRPKRATAAARLPYRDHQRVYNVGFRVVAVERPRTAAGDKLSSSPSP